MARQLVFTSAPQGLTPGRTGYCTVARHGDLRERLVPILESLSIYPSDWQPAPVICTFRLVDVAGTRFPVLSRLVDAGYDYTHRNHYLAHHLILDPAEAEFAPTAADIFLRWPGWLNHWDGPPRWLTESDVVNIGSLPAAPSPPLPALAWKNMGGDAGHATLLLEGAQPASRVLRCPAGRESEILYLFRESAALLPAAERWHAEFTNCLQPSDSPSQFQWVAVRAGSPAEAAATRTGVVLDLTRPETLPIIPTNATTRLARGEAKMPDRPSPTVRGRAELTAAAPVPTDKFIPAPVPGARRAASSGLNFWLMAAVAVLLVAVVAGMLLLSNVSAPAPKLTLPPPTPLATPSISPGASGAVASEQALMDIEQLAAHGNFLEALGKWKVYADSTPELAQAHLDTLNRRLLPGARREWLDDVAQFSSQLESGQAKIDLLSAQLRMLHGLPRAWPFTEPEEMEAAENALAVKIKFLSQMPDAPVWLADNLTAAGSGPDYQDATTELSIPELGALLGSTAGKFRVSAAPATSIALPPTESWFNFQILDTDFAPNSFLVLHDASRGAAGGRFLQLEQETAGKTRLTWRQFQPNGAIFQRFPANDALRPRSREMWLHFAGVPPLPSFYLLLRRLDNTGIQSWKPVSVPFAWLSISGAPATVTLPSWLGHNLAWHASAGQSFHLEPASLGPAATLLPAVDTKTASIPGTTIYQAADLIGQLNEKMRGEKNDLLGARQDWQGLTTAANGPADRQPPQGAIDLAAETVKKIQQQIDQAQAAARSTAEPGWPAAAAPWLLYYTVTSKDTLIFLQFNPHETGPTP